MGAAGTIAIRAAWRLATTARRGDLGQSMRPSPRGFALRQWARDGPRDDLHNHRSREGVPCANGDRLRRVSKRNLRSRCAGKTAITGGRAGSRDPRYSPAILAYVPRIQTAVCSMICQFPISTTITPNTQWGTSRSGGMLNSFRQAGQKFGPSRLRRCETLAAQYGHSRCITDRLGRAKTRGTYTRHPCYKKHSIRGTRLLPRRPAASPRAREFLLRDSRPRLSRTILHGRGRLCHKLFGDNRSARDESQFRVTVGIAPFRKNSNLTTARSDIVYLVEAWRESVGRAWDGRVGRPNAGVFLLNP